MLPPTVLGFFLLVMLGPRTAIGRGITALLGHPLAFSFTGLVVGSVIYSLPFAVQPLVAGFAAVGPELVDAARLLGASSARVVFSLACSACSPFAHHSGGAQFSAHRRRVRRSAHARRRYPRSHAHPLHRALQPGGELRLRSRKPHRRHLARAQRNRARSYLLGGHVAEAAVLEFDLNAQRGSFHLQVKCRFVSDWTVIFGHSGAGKSTLLRLLAGLDRNARRNALQGRSSIWMTTH